MLARRACAVPPSWMSTGIRSSAVIERVVYDEAGTIAELIAMSFGDRSMMYAVLWEGGQRAVYVPSYAQQPPKVARIADPEWDGDDPREELWMLLRRIVDTARQAAMN